jgi:hypothetical protein
MLLSGIQARPETGPPIKTFGGDALGIDFATARGRDPFPPQADLPQAEISFATEGLLLAHDFCLTAESTLMGPRQPPISAVPSCFQKHS